MRHESELIIVRAQISSGYPLSPTSTSQTSLWRHSLRENRKSMVYLRRQQRLLEILLVPIQSQISPQCSPSGRILLLQISIKNLRGNPRHPPTAWPIIISCLSSNKLLITILPVGTPEWSIHENEFPPQDPSCSSPKACTSHYVLLQ